MIAFRVWNTRPAAMAMAALGVLTLGPSALAENPPATPEEHELPLGWNWVFGPAPVHGLAGRSGQTGVFDGGFWTIDRRSNGDLVGRLIIVDLSSPDPIEIELVILDEQGSPTKSRGTTTYRRDNRGIVETSFEDPGGDGLRLGVMALTRDGARRASDAGMEEARELGASILPRPLLGESLDFEFPLVGGGRISEESLRGRIVVIDGWATWCIPCMEKMPALHELKEEYGDALAIVGINFDSQLATAREAIRGGSLNWNQVHAGSADAGHPDLWSTTTGWDTLPQIVILDRDGVVRHIANHTLDLENEVDRLIADQPKPMNAQGEDR